MKPIKIAPNTPFDKILAYSRLIANGPHAWISSTAPFDEKGQIVGIDDAYAQTKQCLDNIETALIAAGFTIKDIVRIRIYLRDFKHKDMIMKRQFEVFKDIRPACSLLCVREFFDPDMLVYIEADAYKCEHD